MIYTPPEYTLIIGPNDNIEKLNDYFMKKEQQNQKYESYEDRHLLYWIDKLYDLGRISEEEFKKINAPDWVYSSLIERLKKFRKFDERNRI